MIWLEPFARLLLIAHVIGAAVLVGSSTHHLLESGGYLRGRPPRVPLEKRYALVVACAYLVTFAIGLLEYPTYKVRVRAEYFDSPTAIEAEAGLRRDAGRQVGSPIEPRRATRDLSWVARLFDIKEHLTALGMAAALALLALSRLAHPSEDPRFAAAYVGLSAIVCSAAWAGALCGLVTATYRSVGGAS